MDLHALTFTALADRHLMRFDPDQEDTYYERMGRTPWCVRIFRRAVTVLGQGRRGLHPAAGRLLWMKG